MSSGDIAAQKRSATVSLDSLIKLESDRTSIIGAYYHP